VSVGRRGKKVREMYHIASKTCWFWQCMDKVVALNSKKLG